MRVAITGGIADGKTTVCSTLAEMSYQVVSADDVVAELYTDPAVVERVRAEVGEAFVSSNGIDRGSLRTAVSHDSGLRTKLNAIFHPAVMREILAKTVTKEVAFAEVPLLIETATQGWFDEVWVVAAGEEEQRRRLVERLGSDREADALLATQLPTAAKIPFADRVVRTNTTVETVKSTVNGHVRELVEERLRA